MKKLIFVLMLVGLLSVVQGSKDVVELGPYDVSFDLGDLNYTWRFVGLIDGETYETYSGLNVTHWTMEISIDNISVCMISGSQYSESVFSEFGDIYDNNIKYSLGRGMIDMDAITRVVDSKNAVLFVGSYYDGSTIVSTQYALESDGWLDHDGRFAAHHWSDLDAVLIGRNFILITIVADWDLTRKLLNTIHVELRDES